MTARLTVDVVLGLVAGAVAAWLLGLFTATLWIPAVIVGVGALGLWRFRPAFALSLLLGAAAVTLFFFALFSQFGGIESMG